MAIDNSGISRRQGLGGVSSVRSLDSAVEEREEAVTNFISTQRWNYIQNRSNLLSGAQAQAYIEELETKTSYQDLINIFQKNNLKKLFGEEVNPKLLFAMVRDLFFVSEVYNPPAEEFFTQRINLLRAIAEITVKDKNFRLLETLPQVLVMGNHDEEEFTRPQRIKLWKEFKNLFGSGRSSYDLPGLVRMQFIADLLQNYGVRNPFIIMVDQLNSDPQLITNVFNAAYQENAERAQQIYDELFEVLNSAELNDLYYTEELRRYFDVVNKMKEINSQVRRDTFASTEKATQRPTVEVLAARPNTTFNVQNALIPTELVTAVEDLEKFLEGPGSTAKAREKIEINSSKFAPGNKDIAAGLLIMIEALPESSPLRESLEDFLTNMPTYVTQMSPPEIKAEILTILKPIFQEMTYHTPDLVNFFGTELSNLEQAAELVTKKVNGIPQLLGLAKNLPKITGYFDPKDYANESCILARQLRCYVEGKSSFEKFASHLGRYQFAMQGIPVHEYVKKVLGEYEKLIQKADPEFSLNLKASKDYEDRVRRFNEFLVDIFIKEQDRSSAIHYLRNLCNAYMDGRLNDQTFMPAVKNIYRECFEPDGAGIKVASDLVYLVNLFVKQNP